MDQKQLSAAILKFSAKVLKELEKDKSTVSSPLSAEFILALLTLADSAGARSELLTVLGFSDDETVRKSFSDLITKLQTVKGITLEVANKIYIKENLKLHPEVEKDATEIFRTETENINFTDPSAAKTINTWAESKTHNKIKDVIAQSTLNADTELVIVNAIYFQGAWNAPFDKDRTTNAPFYLDANTTIMVPMMTHKRADDFQFSHGGLGQLIALPYLGRESSMVILLPYDINGVDEVLQKLADGYDLVSEIDSLSKTKVEVKIPKFKIETEINLGQVLPKLGIKSIFNPGLDKVLEVKRQLRVSQAVQKAFIEVNEVGTEAAAVTVMKLMKKKGPKQFTANRPFVYFLLAVDGTTLFTGVYRGDGSAPCDAKSYSEGGAGDGHPEIMSVED